MLRSAWDRVRPGRASAVMVIALASAAAPAAAQHRPEMESMHKAAGTNDSPLVGVRWGRLAIELAEGNTAPALGPRALALVSVAQLAALEVIDGRTASGSQASRQVAMASAGASVLAALNPHSAARVEQQLTAERARAQAAGQDAQSIAAAEALGRAAAEPVLNRARTDGYDARWTGTLASGAGVWTSAAAPAQPIGPAWATVRPWLLSSPDELRPAAPPAFGSEAFEAALDEVRRIARGRTPEQVAIARRWAHHVDGYWNGVAFEQIARRELSVRRAVQVQVLLNVAMTDALIACYDAKYSYLLLRPSQADPTIEMALDLPNHPSYASGHACASGAAAAVLGHFFPDARDSLTATAEEIALSRLYAGVHYRFDNEIGLALGREIGRRAVARDASAAWLLADR
jgi:hypothetical protein